MKSIIYTSDSKGILSVGETNPLPVTFAKETTNGYSSTFFTDNAATSPVKVKDLSAGKSIYITDLIISSDIAMDVELQDSDGTVIMQEVHLSANSPFNHTFGSSLEVTESKALMAKSSVAGDLTITITGNVI